jgi:hypothetical protein
MGLGQNAASILLKRSLIKFLNSQSFHPPSGYMASSKIPQAFKPATSILSLRPLAEPIIPAD